MMVPKGDNFEKHEGKRIYLEDGVSFKHLKKVIPTSKVTVSTSNL